ncbi:MAG: biotin transporter BioY [candidate division WOR-3 bacterium]|nr:biotin transporter BioY [candidate division WOR-3 bacterium]MCX7837184.1 biotin transporter BioY [candidate division WOR-3 bacterium]MDW8114464.1 biotin transporter BioY [candidate division WOR-3 bacterium]
MFTKGLILVKEEIKEIFFILSFAFLTAISSKIKIEIGVVPITFQTFGVFLSGIILGSKRGALSQLTYLIFGLLGFPFFSRGGGINYIFSPTFGYIIGFIFASYVSGFIKEYKLNFLSSLFVLIFANIIIYIFGLLYLINFVPKEKILEVGLYPFIIGDLYKIFLVLLLKSALPQVHFN